MGWATVGLLFFAAGSIPAADEDGQNLFPPERVIEEQSFNLRGSGLLRFGPFKLYHAALYLSAPLLPGESPLSGAPMHLEVSYLRGIKGKYFSGATYKLLRKSFSEDDLSSLRERIDRISDAYPDMNPGDRCSITYLPGKGTRLAVNGVTRIWIQGADFPQVYFSIWLGENPVNEDLRDELLGSAGSKG